LVILSAQVLEAGTALFHVAVQALPAEATAEQRTAYAAASVAYMNVLPYLAPIYHPFGMLSNTHVNFPLPSDASTLSNLNGSAAPGPSAVPGENTSAHMSAEQGSGSQASSANYLSAAEACAAAAASAAVTASIEAARQMLQGHAAVVQKHLEALDNVQDAVRARQAPADRATSTAHRSSTTDSEN
jgi:hypothetical protein